MYQSEQESVWDQTPLRHCYAAVPQLALMALAAKNNEDARSFGITWESAHTHREERNASYITTRSREIVFKKGREEEVWGSHTERYLCCGGRGKDKKSSIFYRDSCREQAESNSMCCIMTGIWHSHSGGQMPEIFENIVLRNCYHC